VTPASDLLLRLGHQGLKFRVDQGILKCSAAPGVMTDALRKIIREHKPEIIRVLLDAQDASEVLPAVRPEYSLPAGNRGDTAVYIARCAQCGGQCWGPVALAMTETLPNGEEVQVERWSCLDCAARAEGTPAPMVPESAPTTPPWATPSPCPVCDKPHRLFVPASPHIEGEPDRDVLICSKCGYIEPACSDCRGSNVSTWK
jgi:TubC N-terminal docking domain